jgi:hypothetical protein
MKLLFENWRQYLNENDSSTTTYDFEKDFLEEGKLADFIKNKTLAAKKLKDKAYDSALKQFLKVYNSVADKSTPIKTAIKKYMPAPVQKAVFAAVILAVAAAGKPDLAGKIASGNVTLADIAGIFTALSEDLYYGTSTAFQQDIIENGIKAPSEWGSYGLAEENAMKIVEKYGGEPMVIQMPRSEFKINFLLDEDNENSIMYTEDLFIGIEKQEKKIV